MPVMITGDHSSTNLPTASIVAVSYNTAAHIEACLLSLLELDYPRLEIIVVDNASSDGSVGLIRKRFPDIEVVELPDNRGFAGGASVGLYLARGDIVATVNPDVRLDRAWLKAVAATLYAHDDVGVVGSKILYPDGKTIQHAGGVVHYPLATTEHIGRGEPDVGQYDHMRCVSFVTGAALAMRREVGRALDFFDTAFYPVYYEDVDLCWRANQEGLRVIYQPQALAYHKESVTMDTRSGLYYSYYHANRLRFIIKHYNPEQVMIDFLPAEAERMASDLPGEDRRASLNLLGNHLAGSLPEPASVGLTERKWEALQGHVAEVMGSWQVYEKAYGNTGKSKTKPATPRSLRRRLDNLLKRWYVWPLIQKQLEYNASLARTVREMSRQLAELEARVGLQSMLTAGVVSKSYVTASGEDISIELEDLRARLEQLLTEAEVKRET